MQLFLQKCKNLPILISKIKFGFWGGNLSTFNNNKIYSSLAHWRIFTHILFDRAKDGIFNYVENMQEKAKKSF